jgi:hypothetical protein
MTWRLPISVPAQQDTYSLPNNIQKIRSTVGTIEPLKDLVMVTS